MKLDNKFGRNQDCTNKKDAVGETAFCNAIFVQLANNHISNQNGVDCQ